MTNVLYLLVLMVISRGYVVNSKVTLKNIDASVVESIVRQVRTAVPRNLDDLLHQGTKIAFLKSYDDGADGDNERGYYKKSSDNGNDGYKHFDSYHKKNADKYGYETHSAFGKYADDEKDGKKSKYSDENDSDKGAYQDDHNDEEETKNTYQIVENIDGDDGDGDHIVGDHEAISEHYTEGGDSDFYGGDVGHYEDGGDSANYKQGYDGGNYGFEGSQEYEGESSPYSSYESESDGESEHYTSEDDDSDY